MPQAPQLVPAPPTAIKVFPTPDKAAMLGTCSFLRERAGMKYLPINEREIALQLLVHAAGTGTGGSYFLAHEVAGNWSGYNRTEIGGALDQAKAKGAPTCAVVDAACGTSSVCRECPHWNKVLSPVLIKNKNHVATEQSGFHHVRIGEKGQSKNVPDYEGLRRYYHNEAPYVTISDSEGTYRWQGKIWEPVHEADLRGFAQAKFKPIANTTMRNEFLNLVKSTELKRQEWFNTSTEGLMNFQNGVLDIKTLSFTEHDAKYGFRTVLPYDYDPSAECPRFEQFLREVTLDRQELIDIILEFAGYSLSGDKCWEQKAIVLLGEGQNGKSKLVGIIKALAGEGASTSQTFVDLEKDTNRACLDGSLFNIAEETPSRSLMDSSLFKALIGGAEISVKRLYQQPYEIKNRAKFWMLCNEMPRTADKAHALLRRLCIVPFDARFEGDRDDKRIEEKLMPELPGILNLVMRSYKNMLERRGLPESDIARQKLNEYREENDNVWRWFSECCIDEGPCGQYATRPYELYSSYKAFVEDQGEKPASMASFIKRLSMLWRSYSQRKTKRSFKATGEQERAVLGLRIKEEYKIRLIR